MSYVELVLYTNSVTKSYTPEVYGFCEHPLVVTILIKVLLSFCNNNNNNDDKTVNVVTPFSIPLILTTTESYFVPSLWFDMIVSNIRSTST